MNIIYLTLTMYPVSVLNEMTSTYLMTWIQTLPEREPPTYLGLPSNAEKLLLVGLGRRLIKNVKKVTDLLDEGEQLLTEV